MLTPLSGSDPRVVGRFQLQGRLGAGGMGVVYLGFGPGGQPAAVKVINPEMIGDPEFRSRFRREIEAARRVQGSCVAHLLDADPDGEPPWMATEYVDGVSLAEAVNRRGRLQGHTLTTLAVGLADGLLAVHAAGLVHRDLKPANILLSWDGPKIIDFGIVRDAGATGHTTTGTGTGNVIGTVAWMAPEQLLGERAGPATDVFTWAMCIAYAARGRHPFPAETAAASAVRVLHDEPDLDGVPADLEPVLARALGRDPERRPTAVELVSLLVGQEMAGAADAEAATRRLLAGWVAPSTPPSTPRRPSAATLSPDGGATLRTEPATVAPDRRSSGRGRRVVLAGIGLAVLLGALAVAVWALAAGGDLGGPDGSDRLDVAGASPTVSMVTPAGGGPASPPAPAIPPPGEPRATVSGQPLGAGVPVTVLSGGNGGEVPTFHGPTTNPEVSPRRGSVPDGATVTMYCAVYGQPVTARGTTSRLWDYTDAGWINDAYTHTGTTEPLVPGCAGTTTDPRLGEEPPRPDAGPFPVVASGAGLPVRASAGLQAPVIGLLRSGDLVVVTCTVHSSTVPPPPGLRVSSDQWDRITTGGWVPDANLYSATVESVAPACRPGAPATVGERCRHRWHRHSDGYR